mmetsp:Transcript_1643/g.3483  ORF Transcript_1643/g.3483 Transcript_1643/m.3483 type:complete len:225 (-) Transcript_1643:1085-1759(-)
MTVSSRNGRKRMSLEDQPLYLKLRNYSKMNHPMTTMTTRQAQPLLPPRLQHQQLQQLQKNHPNHHKEKESHPRKQQQQHPLILAKCKSSHHHCKEEGHPWGVSVEKIFNTILKSRVFRRARWKPRSFCNPARGLPRFKLLGICEMMLPCNWEVSWTIYQKTFWPSWILLLVKQIKIKKNYQKKPLKITANACPPNYWIWIWTNNWGILPPLKIFWSDNKRHAKH